jgi:undecaprenyl diphosphate synthase
VHVVGARTGLPPDILEVIDRAERRTAHNTRFHLQVAFNYGGQSDIVEAARRFAEDWDRGLIADLAEALGAGGG